MQHHNELTKLASDYINNTNSHLFLTGKAGTGKTTFLKYVVEHTYKNTVVAAPTGIAAINAGGVTLHSLLQLPFGLFLPDNDAMRVSNLRITTPTTLFKEIKINKQKQRLIEKMELLIIDEVSMLRADLLDCIDHVIRWLRKSNDSFGGIQMLFIGDLLQLPPVIKADEKEILKNYYPNNYFFSSKVLTECELIKIELQKVYRQKDNQFLSLLNRFRYNKQTQEDMDLLKEKTKPHKLPKDASKFITITTHNHKVDRINRKNMEKIVGKTKIYDANINGEFPAHLYPVEPKMMLKVGAQVMFIKNDTSGFRKFFNGKIGHVHAMNEKLYVICENDEILEVPKLKWDNMRYTLDDSIQQINKKKIGYFEQYPLKLAWAVTVHKCQGLTFEKAILDPSDVFETGQLYVALSRLTSLEGLVLSSPLPIHTLEVDNILFDFMQAFENHSQLIATLNKNHIKYLKYLAEDVFMFNELKSLIYNFYEVKNRWIKQKTLAKTLEIIQKIEDISKIGTKFLEEIYIILTTKPFLIPLSERMKKARVYFGDHLDKIHIQFTHHIQPIRHASQMKDYVLELEKLESAIQSQIHKLIKIHLLVKENAQNKTPTKEQFGNALKVTHNPASKRSKKGDSALISFQHFEKGMTLKEIAETRELKEGTILSHFTPFVLAGKIEVTKILDSEKLSKILAVTERDVPFSIIRKKLGRSISYNEIKLAYAHLEFLKNKETDHNK